YRAFSEGTLHRDFMGYTTSQTDLLIGLGTSAISEAKYAFAQNLKNVEQYQKKISSQEFAVFKGHSLTEEDMVLRKCILSIACQGSLDATLCDQVVDDEIDPQLKDMDREGFIMLDGDRLQV